MADHQARFAREDVYDHEHEEPRSGRRRRPVADWGVGDDVFEQMPRRRFSRATEGPPRERRFASREAAERRPAEPTGEDVAGAGDGDGAPDREERGRAPKADAPRGGADDGRRTILIGRPEDVPSEIAAITADRDLGDDEPAVSEAPADPVPPAGERRTVRIGGRPEGSLEAARFHREHAPRRRPPRSAHERIGTRPDRLAMWAFALGLLLILIAVLTAS